MKYKFTTVSFCNFVSCRGIKDTKFVMTSVLRTASAGRNPARRFLSKAMSWQQLYFPKPNQL